MGDIVNVSVCSCIEIVTVLLAEDIEFLLSFHELKQLQILQVENMSLKLLPLAMK